jgi:uncharacterized membrane protein
MEMLVAGLVVFLGTHSIAIVNAGWRDRMIARLGAPAWKLLFGLVSLLGLVLIVWGYGLARQEPVILYVPPLWLRHVTLLLLVPVFPLLLAAYLPGRIQTATRHPMLAAVKLWAFAHLLANGMLADVVLFGAFLVWAVADRISLKHRTPPFVPGAAPSKLNDLIAVVAGLGLYVAFLFWLHRWLIGVPPVG